MMVYDKYVIWYIYDKMSEYRMAWGVKVLSIRRKLKFLLPDFVVESEDRIASHLVLSRSLSSPGVLTGKS